MTCSVKFFDPTTIAGVLADTSRASDVTPTSGTFQGVTGHFTARKNAWIVELA